MRLLSDLASTISPSMAIFRVRPRAPLYRRHIPFARWHLHFTPTSSLWLNLSGSWFGQRNKHRSDISTAVIWRNRVTKCNAKVKNGRVVLNSSVGSHKRSSMLGALERNLNFALLRFNQCQQRGTDDEPAYADSAKGLPRYSWSWLPWASWSYIITFH